MMGFGLFTKKRNFIRRFIVGVIAIGVSFFIGVYLLSYLLGPPKLTNEQNTIYYSQSGDVIGEEHGLQSRYQVNLEDISPDLINATLAIEDKHFFEHHGFDLKRIVGAVLKNIKSMSFKEGASTLTQQYARNLYLSQEKTWTRKVREAFYTIRLEMFYSKSEILEGYLNVIYYGHGAHGIEAASHYFFDKTAKELSLAEAAMLAGIPKGPTYYSPLNNEDNANKRQKRILQAMLNANTITKQAYDEAIQEQLTYTAHEESESEALGPYFQDTALKETSRLLKLDPEDIRSGGYEIHTTLNSNLQKVLEKQVHATIDSSSEMEVGGMAMDPDTGAVRAMIGGTDYAKSPFNRAMDAKRMPGSSFKPFLYYAALENGYNATTMLLSKPTVFDLEDGEVYQPSNYNDYYANARIPLAQALALSDNIYAVKTNIYLGADKLVDTAEKFGITSKLPAVPSLALGTATVSLKEMVTGYGILANGGQDIDLYTIDSIVDRNGKTIFERKNKPGDKLLDPKKAFILTQLMTGMFDRELDGYTAVTGSTIADKLTRLYAGKSGTTSSDSWMIGFSPRLVTGIWTGYDDNRTIEVVAESAYSKNIWADFMEAAHQGIDQENFPIPDGVVGIPIDPATGERATPYCDVSRIMYFEKGTEPQVYCSKHFPEDDSGSDQDNTDDVKEEEGILEKWFNLFS